MILTDKDLQMLNSMQQHQQQQHQQQHHQSIDSSMSSSLMTTMTSTTQTATVTDSDRVKDIDLKIEFDGTTVLCRVCGDKASGFHYGVHSCEGCKGFFRRSIQQKIQYRPCTKNQQCSILRINRNRCQYCRLKKCIAVGMSRDAVRFGRVPKREKAKILAAMQKVNAHSLEKALHVVLEDESNLMSAIIKAHQETCDYTKDKVVPLLEAARARPIYAQCPQMTCPLNPLPPSADSTGAGSRLMEDFSERFSPAIHGVVEFAKRIPGFGMLSQEDQVTLLKAGVFEVLLVRLACMFDSQSNSMVCLNGLSLRRDSLHSASNARFLLDSMFEFAERLNALRLSDHEIGLFCSVVVIAPDRPGIRNIDLVQKINKRLEEVLQKAIALNHPTTDHLGLFTELTKKIPDLRTLNALHSEKLLGKSFGAGLEGRMVDERNLVGGSVQPQPDSQSDNSPDRWSSSSSSSLLMGHFSPSQSSEERDRRSVSPSGSASGTHHDWSDSKDGSSQCFGSPRSMSSSSGVSSEDSHSRKGSISLSAAPPKLAYINSYVRGLASTMVIEPPSSVSSAGPADLDSTSVHHLTVHGGAKHRVDSPTDSGIESGKEHANTPTTSVCSSPRSAHGDEPKPKDTSDSELCEKQESIDDMPVLKRALQAPPLVNTNKLMDEAYRHHKKFRAAARRDTEPHSPSTTTGLLGTSQPSASSRLPVEPSTVTVITSHTSPAPTPSTLASAHSTLLKTLEQPSRYLNEQQLKRTDLIHNIIMNTEAVNAPGHTAPLLKEVIHHSGPVTSSASHLESAAGVTVLYPPAAGSYYQVPVPASCPFTGARLGSAPAPPLSAYHPVPVSRTSPSPSYPTESSTAANSLLVISSHQHHHGHPHPHSVPHHHSPGSRSVQQPPSPYSHLQRCLTGSTAPPAMPLHHPAHHHGEARGQLDLDVQPLNLSKKASAPASPVAPTNSIPVSTITSTPPTSSSSSISISPMETE